MPILPHGRTCGAFLPRSIGTTRRPAGSGTPWSPTLDLHERVTLSFNYRAGPRNHCPLGRPPRIARVAAAAHLHPADRARGALAPARALRHHPAAFRPDGAARAPPRGAEDERA